MPRAATEQPSERRFREGDVREQRTQTLLSLLKNTQAERDHPVVIFNADDTLWDIDSLYVAANSAISDVIQASDLDPIQWAMLCSKNAVPSAFQAVVSDGSYLSIAVKAYEQLALSYGQIPQPEVIDAITSIAQRINFTPAQPVVHIKETLHNLRISKRLILLTSGDLFTQQQRIERSGLASYFDAIGICLEKNVETLTALCIHCGIDPDRAYAVGTNFVADIAPALHLGMSGVLLGKDVHPITEPMFDNAHMYVVSSIDQLSDILGFAPIG